MKEETAKRIENDISIGNYRGARERLISLLSTYPLDFTIRKKLGDVYFLMGKPVLAGRYWYLEENKSEEMSQACKDFELSCNHDSLWILRSLKVINDPELYQKNYVYKRLQELQQDAMKAHGYYFQFNQKGLIECIFSPDERRRRFWEEFRFKFLFFLVIGAIVSLLVLGVILLVLGFITVGWYIYHLML